MGQALQNSGGKTALGTGPSKILEEYKRGQVALTEGRESISGLEENKVILKQAREKFETLKVRFEANETKLVDIYIKAVPILAQAFNSRCGFHVGLVRKCRGRVSC